MRFGVICGKIGVSCGEVRVSCRNMRCIWYAAGTGTTLTSLYKCHFIVLSVCLFVLQPLPNCRVFPSWLPMHPSKLWCHCRQVYLPMGYCYAKRIAAEPTGVVLQLREVCKMLWDETESRIL